MIHDPTRMDCFLPQSGLPIKLEGKDLRCIVVRGQVTVRESPAYYDIANGLTDDEIRIVEESTKT